MKILEINNNELTGGFFMEQGLATIISAAQIELRLHF